MKRAVEIAKVASLAALSFFLLSLSVLCWEATGLVRESRALVSESQKRVSDTSSNLNALLIQMGLTADNLRRSSESWEAASQEQRVYFGKATKKMEYVLSEAEQTLIDVRTQTLPRINSAIEANDLRTQVVLDETATAIREMQPAIEHLSLAAENAAKVAGDPNIPATLAHVEKTSEHVEETAENIKKTTAHIEQRVAQATKPASLAKSVGLFLLNAIGSIGNFLRGVS